jgi:TIR domain
MAIIADEMATKSVFLSYAHEQRGVVESVVMALRVRDYDVFFDRSQLKAGDEYDVAIENAIRACDLFVFLISPESVQEGKYTLTELGFAKRRWPNPSGRVLPVRAMATLESRIDAYLRAVTILYPQGNLAAEVAARVHEILDQGQAQPVDTPASPDLLRERITAYRELWRLTGLLPRWPRSPDVTYESFSGLTGSLRDWYFRDGSGMFLSRSAYTAYAALQDSLNVILLEAHGGPVSDEHYEAVRELGSTLRRSLAKDVGARVM